MVLGCAGMAGHVITHFFKSLSNEYEVIDIAKSDNLVRPAVVLDVTNFDKLEKLISDTKPDTIVNCVGLLNQTAENNPDRSILLNSYLPHFLEAKTKNTACKVIHISTDCVFSGAKGGYTESDFMDGKGFYAQSKALGEIINFKDLTIRTSIIGPELNEDGIGLFHWFSKQELRIDGYTNAFWSGVTTIELAKAIHFLSAQRIYGLCHLTNPVKISKYDLLNIMKMVFPSSRVTEIRPSGNYVSDKSLINTRADFNYPVPKYAGMIREMKKWIAEHIDLYPHYRNIIA